MEYSLCAWAVLRMTSVKVICTIYSIDIIIYRSKCWSRAGIFEIAYSILLRFEDPRRFRRRRSIVNIIYEVLRGL